MPVGSSPTPVTDDKMRAAGPKGRRLVCTQVIGVRFPGGPLVRKEMLEGSRITVCRAALLTRISRRGDEGSNSLAFRLRVLVDCPDGEMEIMPRF